MLKFSSYEAWEKSFIGSNLHDEMFGQDKELKNVKRIRVKGKDRRNVNSSKNIIAGGVSAERFQMRSTDVKLSQKKTIDLGLERILDNTHESAIISSSAISQILKGKDDFSEAQVAQVMTGMGSVSLDASKCLSLNED